MPRYARHILASHPRASSRLVFGSYRWCHIALWPRTAVSCRDKVSALHIPTAFWSAGYATHTASVRTAASVARFADIEYVIQGIPHSRWILRTQEGNAGA